MCEVIQGQKKKNENQQGQLYLPVKILHGDLRRMEGSGEVEKAKVILWKISHWIYPPEVAEICSLLSILTTNSSSHLYSTSLFQETFWCSLSLTNPVLSLHTLWMCSLDYIPFQGYWKQTQTWIAPTCIPSTSLPLLACFSCSGTAVA